MIAHSLSSLNEDIYLPQPATIVRSELLTALDRFIEIRLDSKAPLGHMPGQFVGVSVPGIGEAPISISSSPEKKDTFELVVRKVGRVTDALHTLTAGASIGIRGPLGTSFPVDSDLVGKDLLFICGGIGLIPVRSAIQYVLNRRKDYGHITILYGARTPADRIFQAEIDTWRVMEDVNYQETVDRGDDSWKGRVGVITTLLPDVAVSAVTTRAIICGPPIMYKFVITGLAARGVPLENICVSLERRMKCGVGKCGHCQINGLYVCIEGPVFNYATLADIREAI
jgi:NAD(P)H-flavin reductase